ncbi:MAG: TFIIB-type zinc ribbon-containing protein [Methanomassiliicoccales archaeon]
MGRKVLVCPECGSPDLYYEAGLLTGYKYHCKRCDYIGAFVIEKDMDEIEEERSGEHDA